jgi:hypothetical protein
MLGAALYLRAGAKRDLTAALAWLIRAQAAQSEFADKFFAAVYQQCTPEERAEAAKRAALPLGPDDEAAP